MVQVVQARAYNGGCGGHSIIHYRPPGLCHLLLLLVKERHSWPEVYFFDILCNKTYGKNMRITRQNKNKSDAFFSVFASLSTKDWASEEVSPNALNHSCKWTSRRAKLPSLLLYFHFWKGYFLTTWFPVRKKGDGDLFRRLATLNGPIHWIRNADNW